MRFLLGLVAGVFLTLTIYKGWPYVIQFDDLPETPLDYKPKYHYYRNGQRLMENEH